MFFLHNKIISNNFFTFESLFLKLFFIIKLKFFFFELRKTCEFSINSSSIITYTIYLYNSLGIIKSSTKFFPHAQRNMANKFSLFLLPFVASMKGLKIHGLDHAIPRTDLFRIYTELVRYESFWPQEGPRSGSRGHAKNALLGSTNSIHRYISSSFVVPQCLRIHAAKEVGLARNRPFDVGVR